MTEKNSGKDKITLLVAAALLALVLIVRLCFVRDLNGSITYEFEAASRLLAGQRPYLDFFFDQPLFVLYCRLPLVIVTNAFIDAFKIDTFLAEALVSYFACAAAALLSFGLCARLTLINGISLKSRRSLISALIGFALANFAVNFYFGCLQHWFCLLTMPYIFLRFISVAGGAAPVNIQWHWRILCGATAGLAAALNPLFMLFPLIFEFGLYLNYIVSSGTAGSARADLSISSALPRYKIFNFESVALVCFAMLPWSLYFILAPAALKELTDWIYTLKLSTYYLDQIAYFGLGSSPDRRDLLYLTTFATVIGFGLAPRLPLLSVLASLSLYGFAIYLFNMSGLSSDAMIMLWGMVLSLTVQGGALAESVWLARQVRRLRGFSYKQTDRLQVTAAVALIFFALAAMSYFEYKQRQTNIEVFKGRTALDPDLLDCEQAIVKFSRPHDQVMILSGRLLPAFPIFARTRRNACGYFLSGEPFGAAANLREHQIEDSKLDKPAGWLAACEANLFKRLGQDIATLKPQIILVESGQVYDNLLKFGVLKDINANYEEKGEVRYHSWCGGAREFADWNYRYNTYVRK